MEFTRQTIGHSLKSDLARYCLPQARRDPDRKLAWVNSICFLFVIIGIVGARRATPSIKPPPPIEEVIPAVIEPLPPPPTHLEVQPKPETENEQKSEAPQVVVATPETPAINFSVPTIANLVVPEALASAPPGNPMRPLVAAKNGISTIFSTGERGERPKPPYPPIALDLRQQGTVLLSMSGDQNGTITNIVVKESSGFPILDHATLEYVKRHWQLTPGTAGQIYEAPIAYVLQTPQ